MRVAPQTLSSSPLLLVTLKEHLGVPRYYGVLLYSYTIQTCVGRAGPSSEATGHMSFWRRGQHYKIDIMIYRVFLFLQCDITRTDIPFTKLLPHVYELKRFYYSKYIYIKKPASNSIKRHSSLFTVAQTSLLTWSFTGAQRLKPLATMIL